MNINFAQPGFYHKSNCFAAARTVIVSTILRLHIVRDNKEIINMQIVHMHVNQENKFLGFDKTEKCNWLPNLAFFSAHFWGCSLGMMLQSTGTGGPGTAKMFQALRAQSKVVKLLLSIYRAGS